MHLTSKGTYKIAAPKVDFFIAILERLLRDKSMPADQFQSAYQNLSKRYGNHARALCNRGMDIVTAPKLLIGDVRIINGQFHCIKDVEISERRDAEFAKRKYKKRSVEVVALQKSIFELVVLVEKMKGNK